MTSAPTSKSIPTASDFRPYAKRVIRIVEAQHRISTDRLVDGPAEQDVLERLVEEVKPTIPSTARGLHHLLATPFRYGYARETRFRRAGERPGIFYASEQERTALAETAYWRMRFYSAAAGVLLPTTTAEHWAFSITVRVERALDLTAVPFSKARRSWTDPLQYGACQRFAASARGVDAQLIRYESARDPKSGANIALFDPAAFQKPVPRDERMWHFRFQGSRLTAFAAGQSNLRHDFTFEQFGLTPP